MFHTIYILLAHSLYNNLKLIMFFILGDPQRLNFMCRRCGTLCHILPAYTTYKDGIDRVSRNVGT